MAGMRKTAIGALCALAIGSIPAPIAAEPGGWGPLTKAYNDTGQELFRAFADEPGNIVLSPYSVGTAMAMVLDGARGGNEAEMAKVLGLHLSRDEVNAANGAVLASLNSAGSGSFQLRIANALMLTQKGNSISQDYVSTLQKDYAAEIFRGADLAAVNGWVKEKTDGKIDSILDQLDSSTALVLVDAVYFKAPWENAFSAKATRDETFHLAVGEANVPMMHIDDQFALVQRNGYRAIRLPYAGGRIGMVVVLPDAGVADVVQRLDGAEMQSLLAAFRDTTGRLATRVEVSLPRFHASFRASLVQPFTAMGMHSAFDPRTADFSGMTGKPPSQVSLAIGQIVHRAVIDVAEQGTEAAAATGISMVATAMAPNPAETFRVDRPFVFAIVDDTTDAILFEGRIVDPR